MKEDIEFMLAFKMMLLCIILPEFLLKIILKTMIPIVKSMLYFRQRLMIRNIHDSFPNLTSKEVIKIANDVWYNIGWTFISTIKYINIPKKIIQKIKFKNKEKLNQLKGNTIIFTAHIGQWELLAQRLVLEGYNIAAIVRPLRNKLVDFEVKKIREKFGGKVFYAHQLKEIMNWLKSGGIVYLLPDQHIAEGSIRVDFLGKKAFTTPILTLLNKRLNSKIIPMFCIHKGTYYEVFIEGEYRPVYTSDLKHDLEYNTLQINKIIEKYISKYPSQWMWLHRRWKER